MMELKDLVMIANLLIVGILIPTIKALFDMRLKLEKVEVLLKILRDEIDLLKKSHKGGHDESKN